MPPTKLHHLLNQLSSCTPVFKVRASAVDVLHEPSEFYGALIGGIRSAQNRIILTSLYLGHEDLERRLVEELRAKLDRPPRHDFYVHVHVDMLRGIRGKPSTADLLLPLVRDYPQSMRVSMFLTNRMRRQWKLRLIPPRWQEIFGLSHLKFFVFDDNVMLSGANLSRTYFENRADRYIRIRDSGRLAEYYQSLANAVAKVSESLADCGRTWPRFVRGDVRPLRDLAGYRSSLQPDPPEDGDVFVMPAIQMSPFGINQELEMLKTLVSALEECPVAVTMASGYFNPWSRLVRMFSAIPALPWRILTSAPEANGFFRSGGLSGYIPDIYRSFERRFLLHASGRPPLDRDRLGREVLFEYGRPGWTFHAKGIWFESGDGILGTLIGSSNYGYRSFCRDLENQALLLTTNPELRRMLCQERDCLFEHATPVSESEMETGWLIRLVSWVLRSYF